MQAAAGTAIDVMPSRYLSSVLRSKASSPLHVHGWDTLAAPRETRGTIQGLLAQAAACEQPFIIELSC